MRDWEVLRRFAAYADITLVVGGYPGFQPVTRDGIRLLAADSTRDDCRRCGALRHAMRRLTADERLRDTLGRNGRARAEAFGWDAIAEREWTWIRTFVAPS